MTIRWRPLIAVALVQACATVPDQPPEAPVVVSLAIRGAHRVPEAELRSRILTSDPGFWGFLPFGERPRFSATTWQADLRRILRLYQARGFYQARVVDSEVKNLDARRVALRLTLDEGPVTTVGDITIEGLEELSERERADARATIPLRHGAVFLEQDWEATKRALAEHLHRAGYAEAVVRGEVRVLVPESRADARLVADVGQRYRFGRILSFPAPDAKVKRERIVEQVAQVVKKGAWYSPEPLAEAQARLQQMGVFSLVKVSRGAPDRSEGTVPVQVNVREAPLRTNSVGFGLGLDQRRQEGRAFAVYSNRNFFGELRRLTASARAGYAFLPTVLQVVRGDEAAQHGVFGSLTVEAEQPRIFTPNLRGVGSIELTRELDPTYEYYGGSARVALPWRLSQNVVFTPSVNLDVFRLSQAAELDAQPEVLFGCPLTCVRPYLEQRLEWDRRDSPIEPRSGFYLGLQLQEGGLAALGIDPFLRVLPEARGYASFGRARAFTLGAKLRLGTLLTSGESPIIARFFSGGGSAMRGFGTRRLSPLRAYTATAGIVTLPVGGDGLVESSVEVRYNVAGDLVLAAFADIGYVSPDALAGQVTAREGDSSRLVPLPRALQWATGLGLRYRTPIGPIRLDLAFRLPSGVALPVERSPSLGDDVIIPAPASCFGLLRMPGSYAGAPEDLCNIHVGIGEAF